MKLPTVMLLCAALLPAVGCPNQARDVGSYRKVLDAEAPPSPSTAAPSVLTLTGGKDEVVGPFKEVCAGLGPQAFTKLPRKSILLLKGGDLTPEKAFGVAGQRPVKGRRVGGEASGWLGVRRAPRAFKEADHIRLGLWVLVVQAEKLSPRPAWKSKRK